MKISISTRPILKYELVSFREVYRVQNDKILPAVILTY